MFQHFKISIYIVLSTYFVNTVVFDRYDTIALDVVSKATKIVINTYYCTNKSGALYIV